MSDQRATPAFRRVDEKLAQLSPIPSERCIFRVHERLRKINEKAYEPKTIAIGPYHHCRHNHSSKLQAMEEHKLHYLQQLLKRRNETSVERYIMAMQELEGRARNCYAEPINLDTDEFVEMLLLDSCFIVEFLRKADMPELRAQDDPIFKLFHIRFGLMCDLMLFENQLPFFVLLQLFNMTKGSSSRDNIISLSLSFYEFEAPLGKLSEPRDGIAMDNIDHLLDLVHYCSILSFQHMLSERNKQNDPVITRQSMNMKSATELQEAGVKFKMYESSFLDIRFGKGIMEIPCLRVEDGTESILRNLIAHEQYLSDNYTKYFSEYTVFMDYLVNSSKDVEILRLQGIIHNFLGDDEVVSAMMNKLGLEVSMSGYVCYSEVIDNVNKHCGEQCNVWMASLRRNYFNSPWALISFLAAAVLLLLTFAQTVFSIFSVTNSPKSA